jgi:hypothetical protein
LGGILGLTKVILDNVVHIQIRFGVLDDRKLERLRRPKRNRSGREDQLRRRRSRSRSRDAKRWWRRSRNSDAGRRWRREQWNRHRRVGHGKVRRRRSREILLRQRTQRRSSESRHSCHRCRRMTIVRRRWRSMTKPPRSWEMMIATKDNHRNRFGNGTREMELAKMLSSGGSRETRVERRS